MLPQPRKVPFCQAGLDSCGGADVPANFREKNMTAISPKTSLMTIMAAVILLAVYMPVQASERHCQSDIGQTRANTPSSEFELLRDGTVVHRRTGLQWAQCALGQSWSRDHCGGTAQSFSWNGARRAIDELNANGALGNFNDWRLPTQLELESIVESCREAPAININIFPNTPSAGFWTANADTTEAEQAWFIGFYYGLAYEYASGASYRVRPVRNYDR